MAWFVAVVLLAAAALMLLFLVAPWPADQPSPDPAFERWRQTRGRQ